MYRATIDFSLLKPIPRTNAVPDEVFYAIFPELKCIVSWKRYVMAGLFAIYIKRGWLDKAGRYRIEITRNRMKIKAKLIEIDS